MKTTDFGSVSDLFVSLIIFFLLALPNPSGQTFDQYGIKCKFGRFGQSPATYINKTTILCLTPNIADDPADISTEAAEVTVAMNGVDFNDDYSDLIVTFVGTGGGVSTWVIIMGSLIFGLLIVAVLIFIAGLRTFWDTKRQDLQAYTLQDEMRGTRTRITNSRASSARGNLRPRFAGSNSRAGDPNRLPSRGVYDSGNAGLGNQGARGGAFPGGGAGSRGPPQ